MKTKSFFASAIIMMAMIAIFSLAKVGTAYGQTTDTLYIDSMVIHNQYVYEYCPPITSVIVYSSSSHPNDWWQSPSGAYNNGQAIDSAITTQANQGSWTYWGNGLTVPYQVWYLTPVSSPNFPDTIHRCGWFSQQLDAGNPNNRCKYQWNTGDTTQTIDVSAPGTYIVKVMNHCSTIWDTVVVAVSNSNKPNLGPDLKLCQGTSYVLDPGTGFISYQWNPASADSFMVISTADTISVRTTDVLGCIDADTIIVNILSPPTGEIKRVTVDSVPGPTYGNNVVEWNTNLQNVDSVFVWMELQTNLDTCIGRQSYASSRYVTLVNSKQFAKKFKVSFVDTCGNEGGKSPFHETSKITIVYSIGGYTASWNKYDIEGSSKSDTVTRYDIFMGDALNHLNFITYVSGGITTFGPFNFSDSVVVIGAVLPGAKTSNVALSYPISPADTTSSTVTENSMPNIAIYPNPVKDILNIDINGCGITKIQLFNINAQMMYTGSGNRVNMVDLAMGSYYIKVTTTMGVYYSKVVKE
ncbi:MAG: T9SS type A sorting domain-containing protein [bacterium]